MEKKPFNFLGLPLDIKYMVFDELVPKKVSLKQRYVGVGGNSDVAFVFILLRLNRQLRSQLLKYIHHKKPTFSLSIDVAHAFPLPTLVKRLKLREIDSIQVQFIDLVIIMIAFQLEEPRQSRSSDEAGQTTILKNPFSFARWFHKLSVSEEEEIYIGPMAPLNLHSLLWVASTARHGASSASISIGATDESPMSTIKR
jgi:hypothetical protein